MLRKAGRWIAAIGALVLVAIAGWWAYDQAFLWQAELERDDDAHAIAGAGPQSVKLSPQARKNLGLVAQPVPLTTYWRRLELPGVIVDRPGISDHGITAPVSGVVTEIHAFPGDMVKPAAPLFTLRLASEALHVSQMELFKATKEIAIANQQRQRLQDAAQSGALPQSRITELDNQIERLQVSVQAHEQNLAARGLPVEQIDAARQGRFATEITVRALDEHQHESPAPTLDNTATPPFHFEMQSLSVELGQHVEAGSVLCHLADHRALLIEGRGFESDLPWLQQAAQNGWEIEVDFDAARGGAWPDAPAGLTIRHLSNTIDPDTRTLAFFLLLENQWQSYAQEGDVRLLWRFRPGSRVRLRVPVERWDHVFVVPRGAVVHDGPDRFVFRQNGQMFDRRPVHVVHEDRMHAVIANDGSLRPGFFIAQGSAAALQRILKSQASDGLPAGMHVHADGTIHGAH